jgi:pyruvate formate lyase activating enzyme
MDELKGVLFHIIHGSFVDGYGIRTTVFFKGCPLRCHWCCNPEGQTLQPELKFTASLCNGCGNCVEACPEKAIKTSTGEKIHIMIDRKLCSRCGECIEVCYTGALDWFGKYYSVDEVFETVKKDVPFYRSSGGGVSIGGGEPTFQAEFTHALLRMCKENHIHTAVDTCGYNINDKGLEILEQADLLLFDLKGIDPDMHLQNTGVSNERILSNLKHLDAIGRPIIVRVPLIPGRTDSDQNIQQEIELLSRLKSVERVDIMAYHEYGVVKYEQLGKEYTLTAKPYSDAYLGSIKNRFEQAGLNVQLGG